MNSPIKSHKFFCDIMELRDTFAKSHKFSAGIDSYLRLASNEIVSAVELLNETAVCFLQDHPIGTNVRLPKGQAFTTSFVPFGDRS